MQFKGMLHPTPVRQVFGALLEPKKSHFIPKL